MKYYFMTQTGGLMEDPELRYSNLEEIEADTQEEARAIYENTHNNSSFDPAIYLGKEGDLIPIEKVAKLI